MADEFHKAKAEGPILPIVSTMIGIKESEPCRNTAVYCFLLADSWSSKHLCGLILRIATMRGTTYIKNRNINIKNTFKLTIGCGKFDMVIATIKATTMHVFDFSS